MANRPDGRVSQGAVSIVPNVRLMKFGDRRKILQTYEGIVDCLLRDGRDVNILWRSRIDRSVVETLRRLLAPRPGLFFPDLDLDPLEIVDFFARFDLVLPARYHALVLAYKAGTPALVFGWASKYGELMEAAGKQGKRGGRDQGTPELPQGGT